MPTKDSSTNLNYLRTKRLLKKEELETGEKS